MSQLKTLNYRNIASSEEMNAIHTKLMKELLTLHNNTEALTKEVSLVNTALSTENAFLLYRLNDLETKLADISQQVESQAMKASYRTHTIFPSDVETMPDGHAANVDLESLSISISPTESISKVNLYDETLQQTFVPDSLKLTYGPNSTVEGRQVLQIEDNGAINAFDGHSDTYWIRKYTCDLSLAAVECELIVTLPEDMITSRLINHIKINPYPAHSVDVVRVDIKRNGNWTPVPGFSTHSRGVLAQPSTSGTDIEPFKRSPNLAFDFKDVEANEIRIWLRQEHYLQADGELKEMFLGLKNVEVSQRSYHRDYSTFQSVVTFKEEGAITIQDTEFVLNNANEMTNPNIQYEYYSYDELGQTHRILKTAPFELQGKKLLVIFKIPESTVTPNISKINVHYSVGD